MSLEPPPTHESPLWSRSTKILVIVIALLLLALLAQRFQSLIGQIVMAGMLAYILNPIINLIDRHLSLKRSGVIILVYLLLAVVLIWVLISLGVAAYQQISTFIDLIPRLISDVVDLIGDLTSRTEPIVIGGFSIEPGTIPWSSIADQIVGLVEPTLRQGGQFLGQFAATTIGWLGTMFFVFMISVYLANEIPQLSSYVGAFAQQPGYRQDAERLMREIGRIWSAYLRGQVILGLIIFVVVWMGLLILGVQNALALGLLAGLLEFIPNLGPVISALVAVVVAFFQPENYLGLPGWQYALAVLALMVIIQQLENTVLVPRIVGEALDLHPILVILGVFMGGAIAGILGAVLAAPVLATIKLLGIYTWRKIFDLPPFPEPEAKPGPSPSMWERLRAMVMRWGQGNKNKTAVSPPKNNNK